MTPFDLTMRLIGQVAERSGDSHHPAIQWFHEFTMGKDTPDEVPWCSSYVNWVMWLYRLPRSKSAAARSWLEVGASLDLADARPGVDIVILKRGTNPAQGHVGFYAGMNGDNIRVLGANQGNNISIMEFNKNLLLGVRRVA